MSSLVFIGLGSNLDDPVAQLRRAVAALNGWPELEALRVSSLYRTPPMGPPGQAWYVNAVAGFRSTLSAPELLERLQAVEQAQGRDRSGPRWGPRTLDLDLLVHGETRIETPRLVVPHPGIAERAFVLVPLAELAPRLEVPGLGRVEALLQRVDVRGIERILPPPLP